MAPVYEAVPKDAPPTALNCPMIVVEALTVSEPDDVALPKSVLPVSVVDAMTAERLALNAPPMLSAPPTVDDAVTASAEGVAGGWVRERGEGGVRAGAGGCFGGRGGEWGGGRGGADAKVAIGRKDAA